MAAVKVHTEKGVRRLVLCNPTQRNALTSEMMTTILRSIETVKQDDVRLVVIRGEGDIFSSGYAFTGFPQPSDLIENDDLTQVGEAIAGCPCATLAVLNGDTIGAAFDLSLAADFRIAVGTARLGITPAKFGLVYSWHGIARACAVLGLSAAKRLFLTAELVDAATAMVLGAVDEVCPDAASLDVAEQDWTRRLTGVAPLSVAGTKEILAILSQSGAPSPEQREHIMELRRAALDSDDVREALSAFKQRRPAAFKGR